MFLKRLVAFIVSLIVILNICVINIYAFDEDQSYLDWLKQACTNVGDLIDGNITTDEFLSRSSELVVNPQNVPSMALNTYTQIQDSIRSLSSDMLPQDFYNFLGKIASPLFETHREYVKKPSHDLKGYGALYIQRRPCSYHSGFYDYFYNYCDYILLHNITTSPGLLPYLGAIANRTYITVIVCGYDNSSKEVTSDWKRIHVGYDGSINPGSYPECIGLYGDVRESDGSPSDVVQDDSTYVYPDETCNVGELPDGTQVSINDLLGTDGTIDGDIVDLYLDLFDEEAVNDLIDRLIDALVRVGSVTDSSDLVDSVIDDVGDVPFELEGLDGLMVPTSVAHVFPFCLPWDFVQGMYLFKADPEVPKFSFNIEVPSFLGVPEQHWNIDVDFSQFETLAKITRWGFMVLFVYTLILLTGKIVKGAGA